jgi:integrase
MESQDNSLRSDAYRSRSIPICKDLRVALKKYLRWRSKISTNKDRLFVKDDGHAKQPLWPGTIWRRNVAPAIKRAEINKAKLGWHPLRRSYASLLLATGASLRVSMELMRHSTAEMTLATYAQTIGEEKRDAGGRVAALVMGSEKAA